MPLPPGRSRLLRRHFLAPQEQVKLETHPSKWWYFWHPFLAALPLVLFDYLVIARADPSLPLSSWLGGPSFLAGTGWTHALETLAIILTFAWFVWVGWMFYLWVGQTYAVTDERIIQQVGIVRHDIQEIPIRQIRDVEVFQPKVVARILRYGTLRFKSLSEVEPPPQDPTKPRLRHPFETDLDPRTPLARRSGVEWWIGVPNPFRIERTVQVETRAAVPPASAAAAYP